MLQLKEPSRLNHDESIGNGKVKTLRLSKSNKGEDFNESNDADLRIGKRTDLQRCV